VRPRPQGDGCRCTDRERVRGWEAAAAPAADPGVTDADVLLGLMLLLTASCDEPRVLEGVAHYTHAHAKAKATALRCVRKCKPLRALPGGARPAPAARQPKEEAAAVVGGAREPPPAPSRSSAASRIGRRGMGSMRPGEEEAEESPEEEDLSRGTPRACRARAIGRPSASGRASPRACKGARVGGGAGGGGPRAPVVRRLALRGRARGLGKGRVSDLEEARAPGRCCTRVPTSPAG